MTMAAAVFFIVGLAVILVNMRSFTAFDRCAALACGNAYMILAAVCLAIHIFVTTHQRFADAVVTCGIITCAFAAAAQQPVIIAIPFSRTADFHC